MKYVSIFIVIVTDTNTDILNEKIRAYTVIKDVPTKNEMVLDKPQNTLFEKSKILCLTKLVKQQFSKKKGENIEDVNRRLNTNYSFGQLFKNICADEI